MKYDWKKELEPSPVQLEPDSREKLLADAEALVCEWDEYDGDYIRIYGGVAYAQIKDLLDRQAAITKAECDRPNWEYCDTCDALAEYRRKIDELEQESIVAGGTATDWYQTVQNNNAELAELEAERDEWKTKCETCEVAYKQADAERKRYSEQIDGLFAERDELQAKLDANGTTNGTCPIDDRTVFNAIESELAERYMPLPLDADGVPIRLGDVMDGVGMYDNSLRDVTGEVIEVSFNATDDNECVASVALQVWSEDGKSWRMVYIDQYADRYRHHVKPRTIEDVLLEFSERVCRSGHQWGLDAPDVVPEYADVLRSMGVDE